MFVTVVSVPTPCLNRAVCGIRAKVLSLGRSSLSRFFKPCV